MFIIQISRYSTDIVPPVFIDFSLSLSLLFKSFCFVSREDDLARAAPRFIRLSLLSILSSFHSLSLSPSHSHTPTYPYTHTHAFSHFFPLKSCNLQLLYNMTENTLDHDNTIIIVLRFLIFLLPLNFRYAFIFLLLSIHLGFFFLVREYHKTFMFTYRTSYNDTASPRVL